MSDKAERKTTNIIIVKEENLGELPDDPSWEEVRKDYRPAPPHRDILAFILCACLVLLLSVIVIIWTLNPNPAAEKVILFVIGALIPILSGAVTDFINKNPRSPRD